MVILEIKNISVDVLRGYYKILNFLTRFFSCQSWLQKIIDINMENLVEMTQSGILYASYLQSLKKVPGCAQPLALRALPVLASILATPQHQPPGLVNGALDLLAMLLKGSASRWAKDCIELFIFPWRLEKERQWR